jgi:DnaJ homolog subfamily C member 3
LADPTRHCHPHAARAAQAALEGEFSEVLVVIKIRALLKHERFDAAVQLAKNTIQERGRTEKLVQALQDAQTALRKSKIKDYHKVLGVDRDADDKTLKRMYRKLALQYHPDKVAQKGGDKEAAEKKFAEVTEAYEVLTDPEKRALHDQGRDVNDPNAGFGGGGGGGFGGGGFGGQGFHFGGQHFNVRFG